MKSLKSFHFVLNMETAGRGLAYQGEGDFVLPGTSRIALNGTTGKIEMIVIDNNVYMKQPGSEQYMALPASGAGLGNIAGATNPSETSSLLQLADTATVVGDEKVDNVDTSHISFTYNVDKAAQMAAGSAAATVVPTTGGKMATGDLWIDKGNNYIHKMKFVTPPAVASPQANPVASGDTTLTFTYSKYNEPVSPPIEKPTNVITLPATMGTQVPQ